MSEQWIHVDLSVVSHVDDIIGKLYQVPYLRLNDYMAPRPSTDIRQLSLSLKKLSQQYQLMTRFISQNDPQPNLLSFLSYWPNVLARLPPDSRASRPTPSTVSHSITRTDANIPPPPQRRRNCLDDLLRLRRVRRGHELMDTVGAMPETS